jgi:hypothetical protein
MSVVSTAQHYAGLDCLSDKNRLLKAAPDCLLDKSTLLGRKCPCGMSGDVIEGIR